MEKAKARAEQINALVKEKSMKEAELEGLLVENNLVKEHTEMQFFDKENLVQLLLHEKLMLLNRIVSQEAEERMLRCSCEMIMMSK